MKTLYLHVGHSKTGSSYIQSSLAASLDNLLEQGIYYPDAPGMEKAALGNISSGNGMLLLKQRHLESALESCPAESMLFSSEWLFDRFREQIFIENLRGLVEQYAFDNIKILLFIRNPIEHASSAYQQLIKRAGGIFSIEALYSKYNYPANVARFLEADFSFGADVDISVVNYSYAKSDVLRELSQWLGKPKLVLNIPKIGRINRSLTHAELELQRFINESLGPSGALLSDQLCVKLPEIRHEHVYPEKRVQEKMYHRLLPEIERVNAMISPEHHYQMNLKEGVQSDVSFTFNREQLKVIAGSLAGEIHRLRVESSEVFELLSLPPKWLRFMGETDARFKEIGALNIQIIREYGFYNTSKILDIGSGYGRLAYALNTIFPQFNGEYVGVDILEPHVEWCQQHIEKKLSNFSFKHIDVKNNRYNNSASNSAERYAFDFTDDYFDVVSLFSVFTHMYEKEIDNYLSEIKRLLKPGGVCVATFFFYDGDRLEEINSIHNRIPVHDELDTQISLHHVLDDHTRYFNQDDPLHAIAYEEAYIKNLVQAYGFEVLECSRGKWSGGRSDNFQDVLVIRK